MKKIFFRFMLVFVLVFNLVACNKTEVNYFNDKKVDALYKGIDALIIADTEYNKDFNMDKEREKYRSKTTNSNFYLTAGFYYSPDYKSSENFIEDSMWLADLLRKYNTCSILTINPEYKTPTFECYAFYHDENSQDYIMFSIESRPIYLLQTQERFEEYRDKCIDLLERVKEEGLTETEIETLKEGFNLLYY